MLLSSVIGHFVGRVKMIGCCDLSRSVCSVSDEVWPSLCSLAEGPVRSFVREADYRHQMTNLSPKITANWVFASVHSRGGRFHSCAA